MRILDKRTDFYDYLSNIYRDDTFTFDRTDSVDLTKNNICRYLTYGRSWGSEYREPYKFLLLQVCNTFWLFLVKITKFDDFGWAVKFEASLLSSWEDYNKKRVLCTLDLINFNVGETRAIKTYANKKYYIDENKVNKNLPILVNAIQRNDFVYSVNLLSALRIKIPILKASGLASCIDPLDIYLAFEQYFSLEKQSEERTESRGLTNSEKITNHGFDTKKSFRGKTS